MGQKPPTASEAIKRLTERGLLDHPKYGDIVLTEKGRAVAMIMVRRHRLIETFLHSTLGYSWDEVHDEADKLEHAVSDTFVSRIDALLGHPTRDPHGDPIPDGDGVVEVMGLRHIGHLAVGESAIVDRIHDRYPQLLRYLAEHNIRPGVRITGADTPYPGIRLFQVGDKEVPLAESSLWVVNVVEES
ncbi:Iron-dependent repressor IdeR [Corynebacterium freiburgense]|nr:Iron-dependent repressor IdeR [Corynebacterium freiburgense]